MAILGAELSLNHLSEFPGPPQTEDLDRSTPLGKFSTTLVMGMAEMFSDVHGTHVMKGVSERVIKGLHLGAIPFGYDNCNES